jgi:hypothetical protein
MKRLNENELLVIAILVMFVSFIAVIPYVSSHWWGGTTGVCIFKGSDVPLHGIGVTAWWPGGFGGQIIKATGSTDRTGCFTFQGEARQNYNLSYTYNGTGYIDNVRTGTVLEDHIP